jgi:multidrug efflux pump
MGESPKQRRAAGAARLGAARQAARDRFRPILMTSAATILGVLPIALSLGAASASRQSLGIVVVGGLLGSTFLSLYLVPALYSFLSPKRRAARGRAEVGAVVAQGAE